jgi:MFS family permease
VSALDGFRSVFSLAGPRLPVVSFLARLPAALCPTGTLLMVTALSGIGDAGIVAGALWVGQTAGGPFIGRLADRRGHRPIVLSASGANGVVIVGLVAAVLTQAPLLVQTALALLTGFTVPQVGPLARTRWIRLGAAHPRGRELVPKALSLDTTLDEVSFVAGPALVGILAWGLHPAAGLLFAAGLIAVFGVLFALHPTAPKGVRAAGAVTSRLLTPALTVLFTMTVLQGMVFGATNAGVNALAEGDPGIAGLIWAAMGLTSSVAGVVLTALPGRPDLTLRLRLAVLAQAVLALPLLTVDSGAGAALAVAAIGIGVAPNLIALFGLAERTAPVGRMGEAMTVLGAGLIVGQGVAAIAAGQLADAFGFSAAFVLTCAAAGAALLAGCVWVRPSWYRRARPSSPTAVPVAEATKP